MSSLVFFDGVCNLCDGAVSFILARDPRARFRFASLQSAVARERLATVGVRVADQPASFLLLEDGKLYDRSTAVLRVARHLGWPWSWAYAFILVPRPLRDLVYRLVARYRYRWFGTRDACRVPTPEVRARFLDG